MLLQKDLFHWDVKLGEEEDDFDGRFERESKPALAKFITEPNLSHHDLCKMQWKF